VEHDTSWVRDCLRWGQVNLREMEPASTDVGWWADFFRRTHVDGITVNAGGIVAYYPTRIPHHRRSPALADRDLFGELVQAARGMGLRILARLDVGKTWLDAFHSHPEWFCRTADEQVVRYLDSDLYYTCINGPYYYEFTAAVIREVQDLYGVDGFFDNGWQSMPRTTGICRCLSCERKFRQDTGLPLPAREAWDDRAWREWVQWRYKCLADAWAFFAAVTRSSRPGSIYVGNLHRDFADLNASGVDWLRLGELAEMVQVDLQGRSQRLELWAPAELGRLMRECAVDADGTPKPYYDLFGQWYAANPYMRVLTKPAAEQEAWLAGITVSGARPWFHVIGADHSGGDQRWISDGVIERHFEWHSGTSDFHRGLRSAAKVGLIYTPRSIDFYGRSDAHSRSVEAYRGWYYALMQARVPFDLVHERRLDPNRLSQYELLILPNVACLSDGQVDRLSSFVYGGGSLIASFETSLYNEWGEHRGEFALGEVMGVRWKGHPVGPFSHSYLRIRGGANRHRVLDGFEGTEILPSGAMICPAAAASDAVQQPLGFIPPFIVLPPELTYIREPDTDTAMLFLSEDGDASGRGRRAFLPNDLDRVYWQTSLPDLGRLLRNLILWGLGGERHVQVDGPGLLDVHTFASPSGFQVRIANYTNPNLFRTPCTELYPVGPLSVALRLPPDADVRTARLLVAGTEVPVELREGRAVVVVPSLRDVEVIVFPGA
jgi:hypothetical protein